MKRGTKTVEFSVDQMMLTVASSLIRDFRSDLGDTAFASNQFDLIRSANVAGIRGVESTVDWNSEDVSLQKRLYQIESIFKRYRFKNDLYSDDELHEMAKAKFLETQNRLALHEEVTVKSAKTERILDRAASYIAKVLGVYDDEEHRHLCSFGKRASVGIPSRAACEAARWELPISGSQNQITWFDSEMSQIEHVKNYWQAQMDSDPGKGSIYQVVDSLKLTLVPKTFKSLRSIMPNTTIGSYMSYGLGEMMRKRLRRAGYDITTLQERHKVLACQASGHTQCVTADLSSASDSITVALVKRLFPADWFDILNLGRIEKVEIDGACIESKTFCTMGIGFTFPLQTLVFLSLLKAITSTMKHRGNGRTVSVYGDDMIYHKSIHSTVLTVFEEVGFIINVDKTFVEGHFRESCGGDYFRRVDVRPFQPQNGPAFVGIRAYEAILYKTINGLLRRWSEYEIGSTLTYLLSELERIVHSAKIVPIDFGDDAGIKSTYPRLPDFLEGSSCASPKYLGHGVYRFSYLRFVADLRKEDRHEPFYWKCLRGLVHSVDYNHHGTSYKDRFESFRNWLDTSLGIQDVQPELITKPVVPTQTYRSSSGRRLRRTATFVTISHSGRYTRQSGTSCFEDRR